MAGGHIEATGLRYIEGQFIPTVLTDILVGSVQIFSIVLSNDSGAVRPLVTILDRQGTPVIFAFGRNTPVAPGGAVEWHSPDKEGWRATGGLTWVCDTLNAVIGRISYIG